MAITYSNVQVTKVLTLRGNTIQNNRYTGLPGELTVDTEAKTIRIHDGVTPGGNTVQGAGGASNYSNANVKVYLTTFNGNIVPSANTVYSLGSVTNQWKDLFVSNNTIYVGGVPLGIDATGNLTINGNVIPTLSYVNTVVANVTVDLSSYALNANVTAANVGIIGYIDRANTIQSAQVNAANLSITAANVGLKGYVDQANTIQSSQLISANLGIIGYIDQANTIQSAQLTAANTAWAANASAQQSLIGNLQASAYSNVNLSAYLSGTSYTNYSNVNLSAYLGGAVTIGGNLTVNGNLFINGNSTTINANNLIINDNIIYMANANPANSLDIGFVGHFTATRYQHTGLVRQATSGQWQLFSNVTAEPGATIDFTSAVYDDIRVGNITSPTITGINANVAAANIGIKGYIDQANTIQSAQVNAANLAITAANVGMRGYVDSQSFYSNVKVATYLPTYNGNIAANISKAGYTWTFGSDAVLTLPSGATILESGYLSAGAIRLKPNGGTSTQYLEIAPTTVDGNHVHLMAGSGTELFLGDDNQYVKLANTGGVVINSNDGAGNTAQWTFGKTGTTQFPNSLILAPVSQSITMQSDQYSQLMWENANLTVAPNMAINSNFYVAQNNATLDIGYRDGSSTQLIKSWYWNVDGNLKLPSGGYILNSDDSIYGAGSSYSNVEVATYLQSGNIANISVAGNVTAGWFVGNGALLTGVATYSNVQIASYLPTYTGNIANIRLGVSGILTFADGTTQTTAATGGSSYSNANVTAYTVTMGFTNFSNVNVAALITTNGLTNYSNVNASALITTNGLTNYSNVNVKAYTETMGFQNYGNVNVAAVITTNGLTNYSNVNTAAYLNATGYNLYSNANVASYLPTYSGNVTTLNITANTALTSYDNGVLNVEGGTSIKGNLILFQSLHVVGNIDLDGNRILGSATTEFRTGGNITTSNGYFIGNGAFLTGVVGGASNYGNVDVRNFLKTGDGASRLIQGYYANIDLGATARLFSFGATAKSYFGHDGFLGNTSINYIRADNGDVRIATNNGAKVWTFDNTGLLTFAGSGTNGATFDGNDFIAAPNSFIELAGYTANTYIGLDNDNAFIQTNWSTAGKQWTFANTGSLIFPDNTVQTTAWTGGSYSNVQVATYLPTYSGNVRALNFIGAIQAQVGSSFAYATDAFGATYDNSFVFLPSDANSNAIVAGYTIVGNSGAVTLTVTSATVVEGSPNFVQVATTPTASNFAYPVTVYTANYSPALPLSTITVGNATVSGNVSAQYLFGNGAFLTGIVSGGSYSNVQVATYLPTYSGNIANIRLGSAGVLTFSDGTTMTTASVGGGSSYGNANVTAYTVTMGFTNYGNVNVAALITTNGLTNYSNVNVKAYAETMGFTNYGNVNVAALITTNGLTNYSNVNVIAYLSTASITTTGNITAGNIIATGNVTAQQFVSTGAGTATLSATTNLDLSANIAVRVVGGGTFRLPQLTTAARDLLIAANGDIIYNTSLSKFQTYEGGAWANVVGVGGSSTYSNVNVKAYAESMGYQNYGNVNVAAYVTTNGLTNYSNVNVAAYLGSTQVSIANIKLSPSGNIVFADGTVQTTAAAGGNYSNVDVATYLPTYGGVVTAGNVTVNGNVTARYLFGNGSQLTDIVPSILASGATSNVIATANYVNISVPGGANVTTVATFRSFGVRINSDTQATSATSAAVVVVGGIGAASGFFTSATITTLNGTSLSGSTLTATSSTDATSSSTGALRVTGGGGFGANIWSAKTIKASAFEISPAIGLRLGVTADNVIDCNNGNPLIIKTSGPNAVGIQSNLVMGTGNVIIANDINCGNIRLGPSGVLTFADGTTQTTAGDGSYSNVQVATYLPLYGGAVQSSNVQTTTANIQATTAATNTATGALRVMGGVGIGGNINAGGYLFSSATGGSGTLTNQTAIAPAYQYYALNANVGLADGIGDQRIFNANVFLSATTTYEFECLFSIYKNLAVSNSPGVLQFNLGANLPGVAGFNSIAYQYLSGNSITAITTTGSGPLAPGFGAGTQSGALLTIGFANVASNVSLTIGALNTAAHTNWASIKGIIATSTAGWISPRVNFDSGAGVCYVQAGSYMKIAAIGIGSSGDSNVSIGTWAA